MDYSKYQDLVCLLLLGVQCTCKLLYFVVFLVILAIGRLMDSTYCYLWIWMWLCVHVCYIM